MLLYIYLQHFLLAHANVYNIYTGDLTAVFPGKSAYVCFPSIIINNAPFVLKSIQIWIIDDIVTLFQGVCLFIFDLPVAISIMLSI